MKQLVAIVLALALPAVASAQEDKEAIKKRLLERIEKKLREEEARILKELSQLIDEELAKMKGDKPAEPPKPPEPPKPQEKKPGFLGVQPGEPLTADELAKLKIDGGVRLNVMDGGPADKGGLTSDDIILAIDGEKVTDFGQVPPIVRKKGGGTEVIFSVIRGGEKKDLKIVLGIRGGEPPPDLPKDEPKPANPKEEEALRERLKRYLDKDAPPDVPKPPAADKPAWLGLYPEETDKGIAVSDLNATGPAAKAGLKKGDILTALNGTKMAKPVDLGAFLKTCKPGQEIEATILRDGKEQKLKVVLGEKK